MCGVTKRFRYTLRLVYAHFPITASITNGGKRVEIKNFLGEKVIRTIDMLGDAKVGFFCLLFGFGEGLDLVRSR